MESNHRPLKSSCADYHSEISSPVMRLVQVSDQGVVFESRAAFEVGAMIELGFHVKYWVDSPKTQRLECTEFILGQGTVVDCNFCSRHDGSPIHVVTLLFSTMSRRDRRALRRFTQMEESRLVFTSSNALGMN